MAKTQKTISQTGENRHFMAATVMVGNRQVNSSLPAMYVLSVNAERVTVPVGSGRCCSHSRTRKLRIEEQDDNQHCAEQTAKLRQRNLV